MRVQKTAGVLPVREAPAALFYIVFPGKLNR